ncbi:MAG: hypothetical protein ACTHM1_07990 [Solirubrobacteraceae bacterium]
MLATACAASLSFAAPASASKVIAPPGNAGVGQYVEVVPGAGGSTPVGAHANHGPVLTSAQRQRLEASGGSGKALAAFVQRTGVARSKASSAASSGGSHTGNAGARGVVGRSGKAGTSSSLPAAVPDSATRSSGGGLGWGLFAALGATALAAAGLAIARRRAA